MITGDIKQKVDDVWQTFWNNGFTQPSAIFEQITYLLFMKMLDDKQREKEAIANLTGDVLLNPTFPEGVWRNPSTDKDVSYHEMRWHVFKEMEPTKMLDRVRNDVFIFCVMLGKRVRLIERQWKTLFSKLPMLACYLVLLKVLKKSRPMGLT